MGLQQQVGAVFSQIGGSPPVQWVAAHPVKTFGMVATFGAVAIAVAAASYCLLNTINYDNGCRLRENVSPEMRAALAKQRPLQPVPNNETFEEAQTLLAAGWGVTGTKAEAPVVVNIGGYKQATIIPHTDGPNFNNDDYAFKGITGETENWRPRVEEAFGNNGRYKFLASFSLMESGVDALAVIDTTTEEIILVVPGLNPAFANPFKLVKQLKNGYDAWSGRFGEPAEALLAITTSLRQQYPDKPITKVYSQSMGAAFVLPLVAMNKDMQSLRISGPGINGYSEQQLTKFIADHGGGVLQPEELVRRLAQQQVTINLFPVIDTWTHAHPTPNTHALWAPNLDVPPAWAVNTIYYGFGWVKSPTHRGSRTLHQLTNPDAIFARVTDSSMMESPWTCRDTENALKLQAALNVEANAATVGLNQTVAPWGIYGEQGENWVFGSPGRFERIGIAFQPVERPR